VPRFTILYFVGLIPRKEGIKGQSMNAGFRGGWADGTDMRGPLDRLYEGLDSLWSALGPPPRLLTAASMASAVAVSAYSPRAWCRFSDWRALIPALGVTHFSAGDVA
jgi:hypothetical protein